MISVRSLAGPGSIRGYASRLGASPSGPIEVRRLASADLLSRRWAQYGGLEVLGSAVSDVTRDQRGNYARTYSAGTLRLTAAGAQLDQQLAYRAKITIPGFYCERRAETDQVGGPSSEPYLIATVVDESMVRGDAESILSDVASDVDGGDFIGWGRTIWEGANPGQLQINLAMWEEDGGQSEQIRGKVQTTINDSIQVASIFFPAVGFVRNLLGPVGDRIIGSMANVIKELFKDDVVGQTTVTLDYFDFTEPGMPDEVEWGDTGARFRKVVPINGGKAGIYHVLLNWNVEGIPVPAP